MQRPASLADQSISQEFADMATRQKATKRNVQSRAKRAAKRGAGKTVKYAKDAARAVAKKVGNLAAAARRNPRKVAVATGVAAVAVAGAIRARRRKKG
jgi:hypothetical protein